MKGFAFIPLIFIILVAAGGTFAVLQVNHLFPKVPNLEDLNKPKDSSYSYATPTPKQTSAYSLFHLLSKNSSTPTKNTNPSPTITLTSTRIPTPTTRPNSTPTPTPTSSPDNSCPYNLTGPTGSIKVDIKPSNGMVVGDQSVELQARTGCKILDGRSTDKQTLVARAGGNGYSQLNTVTFGSVPAGPYSIRIQYKGQWTGYTGVDAVEIQGKTVEIFVQGDTPTPTPTPTPRPKPICSVFVAPSSTGTAPYAASVCVGNNSNPYQEIQQEYVDYDGNDSWDYQGASYGCHSYTFQTPGVFSPKAKFVSVTGIESDICQTTATIN